MVFGTFYLPARNLDEAGRDRTGWPDAYGVDEVDYPGSYLGQFLRAFKE